MKKTYTIIDINGKTHVIIAEDVTHVHVDNTGEIAIKFWDYVNFEKTCVAFFNFRNIISVSETYINDVEIHEMSDSMVEPDCKIDVSPETVKHSCATCKHEDEMITAEPCMDCWYLNKWEAKDDQATL